MKLLRPIAAAAVLILVIATPALAQRSPAAAPSGNAAESHDLAAPDAAPTGTVDVSPLGFSSNPRSAAFPPFMFMGAD
jgi:hypothetical protein